MNNGIDILLLDLQDPGAAEKSAVFAYQCDATSTDKQHAYPKQMTFSERHVSSFDAAYTLIESGYDMRNSISTKMTVGADAAQAAFSASAAVKYGQELAGQAEFVANEASAQVLLWQLTLNAGVTLPFAPPFVSSVSALPSTPGTAYQSFIDTYGTHYYSQATYGGRTFQRFLANHADMMSLLTQKVSVSAGAGIALGANLGVSVNTKSTDYQRVQTLTKAQQLTFVGDSPNLKSWTTWAASVSDEPVVVIGALAPIYSLLTSANFPKLNIAPISANMQAAVQVYLAQNAVDPTAGAFHYRVFEPHPASGVLVGLAPLTRAGSQLKATQKSEGGDTFAVKVDPPPVPGLELLNPTKLVDTSTCPTGGQVVLAAETSLADQPVLVINQNDVNQVNLAELSYPPQSSAIWRISDPFKPGLVGAPIFPGAVVQLQNLQSSGFLSINPTSSDQPAIHSDPLDPLTCWTLLVHTDP
jgi:hypothetical protein